LTPGKGGILINVTQIGVWGSAKACALRVARLAPDCAPATGASNGVATSAIIRLAATPNTESGEVYQLKDAAGKNLFYKKKPDRLLDMGLSLDLATRDFELIEMLTGSQLITDGDGRNIGIARRGADLGDAPFISVEIWTSSIDGNSVCAEVLDTLGTEAGEILTGENGDLLGDPGVGINPGWFRVIYPKATFTLGDSTFENGVAIVSLSGFATQNPLWGNGPFNDYPGIGTGVLPGNSPEIILLDSIGPPALSDGYITVPDPVFGALLTQSNQALLTQSGNRMVVGYGAG